MARGSSLLCCERLATLADAFGVCELLGEVCARVPEDDRSSRRADLQRCDGGLDLCHELIVELRIAARVELVRVGVVEQPMSTRPDRET